MFRDDPERRRFLGLVAELAERFGQALGKDRDRQQFISKLRRHISTI